MKVYSKFIEIDTIHTYNKIQRMPRWEEAQLTRTYLQKAVDAWGEQDPVYTPATFRLEVLINEDAKTMPDTDASFWVAKRVLDAAVTARILPDDSPEFVERVILEAPMKLLGKDNPPQVLYRGVLSG